MTATRSQGLIVQSGLTGIKPNWWKRAYIAAVLRISPAS